MGRATVLSERQAKRMISLADRKQHRESNMAESATRPHLQHVLLHSSQGSEQSAFVPRMPAVPSTPLQSDRRESLQNALGSSRVVNCLFVDNGDGMWKIDVQHNRQSTRAQLDTFDRSPPTRPCNTSNFRCITSCFENSNPCRRTSVLTSNR